MALKKNDVVERIYSDIEFTEEASVDAVETLLETMKASLESGDDLA